MKQNANSDEPQGAVGIEKDEAEASSSASIPPSHDPEKPRPTRGYAHLAEFMKKTHHGMMRRYKDLSTLNLLYLQAELYQLKLELDRETAADARCPADDERGDWDYHWRLLATSGLRTEGKRWDIWLNIRERLYEYQDALQKHASVAGMARPTNNQRGVLARIFGTGDVSDGTFAFFSPELLGMEPEVYTEKFLDDLVLLEAAAEENDILERFGARSMLKLLTAVGGCNMKLIRQEDIESGLGGDRVYQYSKRTYSEATRVVGAVSFILVPIGSIVALYAVGDQNVRIGLMCAFSLGFCLGLSALTKTRRIEVFAATAAFMSVQLVFISQGN